MSTWDDVQRAFQAKGIDIKSKGGTKYISNSPFRDGSDSQAFAMDIAIDGEHGAYTDHAYNGTEPIGAKNGSLYDLAKYLGVERKRAHVDSTKRPYNGLKDYAITHGLTEDQLKKAGWGFKNVMCYTLKKERPALFFQTHSGTRYKYLDNEKPAWKNVGLNDSSFQTGWYWGKKAIDLANALGLDYIVMCNGEISSIAGQAHGIPAFAQTGSSGEKKLNPSMLASLLKQWDKTVVIAMDCDEKGQNAAKELHEQLPNSVVIDLYLDNGGDLADYCKLNTNDSFTLLNGKIQRELDKRKSHPIFQGSIEVEIERSRQMMRGEIEPPYKFLNPIEPLRKFGGTYRYCEAGQITGILGGTGTGKTMFLETIQDVLLTMVDGFRYTPEWTAFQMLNRATVRNADTLDYDIVGDHFQSLLNKTTVGRFTPEQEKEYYMTQDCLLAMPNRCFHIPHRHDFNIVLSEIESGIKHLRSIGRNPRYMIVDYAQLLNVKSPYSHIHPFEYAVSLIKDFIIEHGLHCFLATQANKSAQREKDSSEKDLDLQDMNSITGNAFNSLYALNNIRLDDLKTPYYWLTSAKQSISRKAMDRLPITFDPGKFRFLLSGTGDWTKKPSVMAKLKAGKAIKGIA